MSTPRQFVFTVASESTPLWAQGAQFEWRTVETSNAMASVQTTDAGQLPGICSYSSAAYDEIGKYLYVAGGGHNDHKGNEILRIRLDTDTPAWEEVSPPTPLADYIANQAYNGDGTPHARHTWNGTLQWIGSLGAAGQLLYVGCASPGTAPTDGSCGAVDTWDAASRAFTWINPDPVGDPSGIAQSLNQRFPSSLDRACNWAVKDTKRDNVWALSYSSYEPFRLFQSSTRTWVAAVGNWARSNSAAVYDSKRDRIVVLPYNSATNSGAYFSAADGSGLTRFGYSGGLPDNVEGTAWYEPTEDRYMMLCYGTSTTPNRTDTIWAIDPDQWTVEPISTTGIRPSLSTATGYIQHGNRFHYIESLGGCVFVHIRPDGSASISFIRLAR